MQIYVSKLIKKAPGKPEFGMKCKLFLFLSNKLSQGKASKLQVGYAKVPTAFFDWANWEN